MIAFGRFVSAYQMKLVLFLACLASAEALFDTLGVQYAMTGWASGPDTIAGLLWSPAIFVRATGWPFLLLIVIPWISGKTACASAAQRIILDVHAIDSRLFRNLRAPTNCAPQLVASRLAQMASSAWR